MANEEMNDPMREAMAKKFAQQPTAETGINNEPVQGIHLSADSPSLYKQHVDEYLQDSHIDFVDDTSDLPDPVIRGDPAGDLPKGTYKEIMKHYFKHCPEVLGPVFASNASPTEIAQKLPVYALASLLTALHYKGPTGRLELAKEKIADQRAEISDLKGDKRSLSARVKNLMKNADKIKQFEQIEFNVNQVLYHAFTDAGFNYDPEMLKDKEAFAAGLELYVSRAADKKLNMDPSEVRAHLLTTLSAYNQLAAQDAELPLDHLIEKVKAVEHASETQFLQIIRPVFINAVTEDPELKDMFDKEGITDFNTASAQKLRAASVDALIYLSRNLAEARETLETKSKESVIELAKDIQANYPTVIAQRDITTASDAGTYLREVADKATQTARTLATRDQNSDLIAEAQTLLVQYAGLMHFPFTQVTDFEQARTVIQNFALLANDLKKNAAYTIKNSIEMHLRGANNTRDTLRSDLTKLTREHRKLKVKFGKTNQAYQQASKFNAQNAQKAARAEHAASEAEAALNVLSEQRNDLEARLGKTTKELRQAIKDYNAMATTMDGVERENALLTGAIKDVTAQRDLAQGERRAAEYNMREAEATADAWELQAKVSGKQHSEILTLRKQLDNAHSTINTQASTIKDLKADHNSDPAFHQNRAQYKGFFGDIAPVADVEKMADHAYELAVQHSIKPAELVKIVAAARKKFGDGGIAELIHDEIMDAIPKNNLKAAL